MEICKPRGTSQPHRLIADDPPLVHCNMDSTYYAFLCLQKLYNDVPYVYPEEE